MSDFGTTILVVKKSKSTFSNSEISDLSSALKDIIKDDEYEDALGEKMKNEFESVEDTPPSVIVRLSEHHYGDDENENLESFEFVKDVELEDAQKIMEKMKNEFSDFEFEASVDEW